MPFPSAGVKGCMPAAVARVSSLKGLATKKVMEEKNAPGRHQMMATT